MSDSDHEDLWGGDSPSDDNAHVDDSKHNNATGMTDLDDYSNAPYSIDNIYKLIRLIAAGDPDEHYSDQLLGYCYKYQDEAPDINFTYDQGTPLMIAAQYGLNDVIYILITMLDANVDTVNPANNQTALNYAAQAGHYHTMTYLLNDFNASTNHMVRFGHKSNNLLLDTIDNFKLIVDYKQPGQMHDNDDKDSDNNGDDNGDTTNVTKFIECLELLLNSPFDLSYANADGMTALQLYISRVVQQLYEHHYRQPGVSFQQNNRYFFASMKDILQTPIPQPVYDLLYRLLSREALPYYLFHAVNDRSFLLVHQLINWAYRQMVESNYTWSFTEALNNTGQHAPFAPFTIHPPSSLQLLGGASTVSSAIATDDNANTSTPDSTTSAAAALPSSLMMNKDSKLYVQYSVKQLLNIAITKTLPVDLIIGLFILCFDDPVLIANQKKQKDEQLQKQQKQGDDDDDANDDPENPLTALDNEISNILATLQAYTPDYHYITEMFGDLIRRRQFVLLGELLKVVLYMTSNDAATAFQLPSQTYEYFPHLAAYLKRASGKTVHTLKDFQSPLILNAFYQYPIGIPRCLDLLSVPSQQSQSGPAAVAFVHPFYVTLQYLQRIYTDNHATPPLTRNDIVPMDDAKYTRIMQTNGGDKDGVHAHFTVSYNLVLTAIRTACPLDQLKVMLYSVLECIPPATSASAAVSTTSAVAPQVNLLHLAFHHNRLDLVEWILTGDCIDLVKQWYALDKYWDPRNHYIFMTSLCSTWEYADISRTTTKTAKRQLDGRFAERLNKVKAAAATASPTANGNQHPSTPSSSVATNVGSYSNTLPELDPSQRQLFYRLFMRCFDLPVDYSRIPMDKPLPSLLLSLIDSDIYDAMITSQLDVEGSRIQVQRLSTPMHATKEELQQQQQQQQAQCKDDDYTLTLKDLSERKVHISRRIQNRTSFLVFILTPSSPSEDIPAELRQALFDAYFNLPTDMLVLALSHFSDEYNSKTFHTCFTHHLHKLPNIVTALATTPAYYWPSSHNFPLVQAITHELSHNGRIPDNLRIPASSSNVDEEEDPTNVHRNTDSLLTYGQSAANKPSDNSSNPLLSANTRVNYPLKQSSSLFTALITPFLYAYKYQQKQQQVKSTGADTTSDDDNNNGTGTTNITSTSANTASDGTNIDQVVTTSDYARWYFAIPPWVIAQCQFYSTPSPSTDTGDDTNTTSATTTTPPPPSYTYYLDTRELIDCYHYHGLFPMSTLRDVMGMAAYHYHAMTSLWKTVFEFHASYELLPYFNQPRCMSNRRSHWTIEDIFIAKIVPTSNLQILPQSSPSKAPPRSILAATTSSNAALNNAQVTAITAHNGLYQYPKYNIIFTAQTDVIVATNSLSASKTEMTVKQYVATHPITAVTILTTVDLPVSATYKINDSDDTRNAESYIVPITQPPQKGISVSSYLGPTVLVNPQFTPAKSLP